jgi:hypothetical protein
MKRYLIIIIALAVILLTASPALADALVPESGSSLYHYGDYTPCDFIQIFINGADLIVGLAGVMGVVMFVYGGIVLITAYGNESRIKWGQDVLVATVVGIFIVLLAWTLINTIMLSFFGDGSNAYKNAYKSVTNQDSTDWGICADEE